jgi:phosphatidate cytidylyltransferase
MLKTRIVTALVLVPLVLAALFALPPRGWGVLTLAIVVFAATEWARLARFPRPAAVGFVGATLLMGSTLLFAPASRFDAGWPEGILSLVCGTATAFWLIVAPVLLARRWRVESALVMASIGWLVLIATWMAVVELQARSPALLLAFMAIVWIADTAAYFTGRRFGRHKLAPSISPGKTWEGVWGALAATGAYALLLLAFAPSAGLREPRSITVAALWLALVLLLTAMSIVGDLFESKLKRQRGVKDSGNLLPGHGGVLDRIDALIAAMPPAALIAHYFVR